MRILVVGSGGREHALVWKICQSPLVQKVYCTPGNAGISQVAECLSIEAVDLDGLVSAAHDRSIDLVVVGPEGPLVAGLADRMRAEGLKVFGPSSEAAKLEGSKLFAKDVMVSAGVPTAEYAKFSDFGAALAYARLRDGKIAVKADGLAAGKGVFVCHDMEAAHKALHECLVERRFGDSGATILIEDLLEGEEVSFTVLTDGERIITFATARDYKRLHDNDCGPNTGGMGAYSPAMIVDSAMHSRVMAKVVEPTLTEMRSRGTPFTGVLYAGLFINEAGPWVIEFNARFGDPELQPLLHRLRSDIVPYLMGAAEGRLPDLPLEWDAREAVYVNMTSFGYPRDYHVGSKITGLDESDFPEDILVFHAATKRDENGYFVTSGGRVLGVSALGNGFPEAARRAYDAIAKIHFDGAHFRTDIGRSIALNL